jgi:GT2 family glycosyltransferase
MLHPLVFVVILNYNGERWLESCLEAVLSTTYDNLKIILVDNASNDNSCELVKTFFPQVDLIINPDNYGFSEGNNIAIRRALDGDAEYIVLLNPDTKVEPDWLINLVKVGESDSGIGILGAVQLNYEDSDFNSWTKTALSRHLTELKEPDTARQWISVDWVEGACFAVKRKVFEEIGFLDPIYFAFYEEIDFCRRTIYRGYEIALVPRSRVHHFRGGNWQADQKISRERNYRCDRSQFIYNLTDPRESFAVNFYRYLSTLATKTKVLLNDFSFVYAWDLIRIQFDVLINSGKLISKWRRERSLLR